MGLNEEDFWQLLVVAGIMAGRGAQVAMHDADSVVHRLKARRDDDDLDIWAPEEEDLSDFSGALHAAMTWGKHE